MARALVRLLAISLLMLMVASSFAAADTKLIKIRLMKEGPGYSLQHHAPKFPFTLTPQLEAYNPATKTYSQIQPINVRTLHVKVLYLPADALKNFRKDREADKKAYWHFIASENALYTSRPGPAAAAQPAVAMAPMPTPTPTPEPMTIPQLTKYFSLRTLIIILIIAVIVLLVAVVIRKIRKSREEEKEERYVRREPLTEAAPGGSWPPNAPDSNPPPSNHKIYGDLDVPRTEVHQTINAPSAESPPSGPLETTASPPQTQPAITGRQEAGTVTRVESKTEHSEQNGKRKNSRSKIRGKKRKSRSRETIPKENPDRLTPAHTEAC